MLGRGRDGLCAALILGVGPSPLVDTWLPEDTLDNADLARAYCSVMIDQLILATREHLLNYTGIKRYFYTAEAR